MIFLAYTLMMSILSVVIPPPIVVLNLASSFPNMMLSISVSYVNEQTHTHVGYKYTYDILFDEIVHTTNRHTHTHTNITAYSRTTCVQTYRGTLAHLMRCECERCVRWTNFRMRRNFPLISAPPDAITLHSCVWCSHYIELEKLSKFVCCTRRTAAQPVTHARLRVRTLFYFQIIPRGRHRDALRHSSGSHRHSDTNHTKPTRNSHTGNFPIRSLGGIAFSIRKASRRRFFCSAATCREMMLAHAFSLATHLLHCA